MAVLTVSREFGSGGREIGQAVARSLGYDYVDKGRILNDIRAVGKKWEEWGKDLDEHCPTVWEKYDWSFRGFGALIQSTVLEYAARDRVVVMGRGGNFLLKGIPHAFRIRVESPLEARIERIASREAVDQATARWLAEKTDHERSCFLFSLYGGKWDDPAEYDAVFDTGTQSLGKITDIVIKTLATRDQFNTEEARKHLRMRAAAAKVKAGIAVNPSFVIPTLDVEFDGENLVLRGIIHGPKEHKRIEEAARGLAGDLPLKCDLHIRG
jgi:cytidylate kinase